eukprot:GILJ01009957.1.p1 GENE.GILJ01009957.1~~GILJ01009957.1.p1  ORF type:complete len:130 (-),score=4.60 GILJ01009957.1:203-592(-)
MRNHVAAKALPPPFSRKYELCQQVQKSVVRASLQHNNVINHLEHWPERLMTEDHVERQFTTNIQQISRSIDRCRQKSYSKAAPVSEHAFAQKAIQIFKRPLDALTCPSQHNGLAGKQRLEVRIVYSLSA